MVERLNRKRQSDYHPALQSFVFIPSWFCSVYLVIWIELLEPRSFTLQLGPINKLLQESFPKKASAAEDLNCFKSLSTMTFLLPFKGFHGLTIIAGLTLTPSALLYAIYPSEELINKETASDPSDKIALFTTTTPSVMAIMPQEVFPRVLMALLTTKYLRFLCGSSPPDMSRNHPTIIQLGVDGVGSGNPSMEVTILLSLITNIPLPSLPR